MANIDKIKTELSGDTSPKVEETDIVVARSFSSTKSFSATLTFEHSEEVSIVPAKSFSTMCDIPTTPVPAEYVDWDTTAIYYRCTLTGAADGVADIALPISSFQSRARKSPLESYLSAIVPNAALHLPYVVARPNGEIVIEQGRMSPDGITYDDLVRADYENFASTEGARNSSITLTGHRTLPVAVPQVVDLRGVSIVAQQQTGIRRTTSAVDFRARPGDTVQWDSEEMTAGMIAIAVGKNTATMTITEAST